MFHTTSFTVRQSSLQAKIEITVEVVFKFLSWRFQYYSSLYTLCPLLFQEFWDEKDLCRDSGSQNFRYTWTWHMMQLSPPLLLNSMKQLLLFPHIWASVFQTTVFSLTYFIHKCLSSSQQLLHQSIFCKILRSSCIIIMCIKIKRTSFPIFWFLLDTFTLSTFTLTSVSIPEFLLLSWPGHGNFRSVLLPA